MADANVNTTQTAQNPTLDPVMLQKMAVDDAYWHGRFCGELRGLAAGLLSAAAIVFVTSVIPAISQARKEKRNNV